MTTQLSLFGNDSEIQPVPYLEFYRNRRDFEWFKGMPLLGVEHEEDIRRYYGLEYGEENPPLYLADPLNASIAGRTTFHCMIVSYDDGDGVLVCYRSLEFMKKRLHAFDMPISLNRNRAHSEEMVRLLLETGFFTFIFKEKYIPYFPCAYPKSQYNDYYYDLDKENTLHFSNAKWLRKHSVNALIKGSDYSIIDIHGKPEWKAKALACRKMWFEGRSDGRKTDNERKYFENSLVFDDDRVMNIAIAYKDELVLGVKSILVHEGYATDLMFCHLSRNRDEVERVHSGLNHGLMCNLDECMRYATGTMLLSMGVKREYRLGYVPGNETLHAHKERITSGFIKYFSTTKDKNG